VDTTYNPDQGVGVLRAPEGGGSHNPSGARFAFLSGRPYRWAAADLAANVETIVTELFVAGSGAAEDPLPGTAHLALRVANPVLTSTILHLELPAAGPVRLCIFDPQGRLAATLVDGRLPAGVQRILWGGISASGQPLPSGAYQALLSQGRTSCSRRVVLLR